MRYDALPPEILTLNQWVNVWNNSKIPMQSTQSVAASSSNPDTWSNFHTAKDAVERGIYDHLGFVFADNGIVGIDIDAGFDEDGFLSELSVDCMRAAQSYTEKSRSGRGIHILVKGNLPFKGRNNRAGVEIYQSGRYFIMTGNVLVYHDLIENQEAIDYIVDKYFPEMVSEGVSNKSNIYSPIWPPIGDKIPLRPYYPPIPDGCRNISLASLAGVLHNTGYNADQIYDELYLVNQRACTPPLDDSEVLTIVNSITRYKR